MVTTAEARAFGNALVAAIYAAGGGDGQRRVTIDARKAAQICTGTLDPAKHETKYVRELLHRLSTIGLPGYKITPHADFEATWIIEPRRDASKTMQSRLGDKPGDATA